MEAGERLREREKELAAIYSICLLAANAPPPDAAAAGIARALRSAMRYADKAVCRILFGDSASGAEISQVQGTAPSGQTPSASLSMELPAVGRSTWSGTVTLEYYETGLAFLDQEAALLESVLVITASILTTAELITDLRKMADDLSSKNAALREILTHIEEERRKGLDSIRERLATEIMPLAERARDGSIDSGKRDAYLGILVDELVREVRGLGGAPARTRALSPREREIAVQVRNGRTSKEIAALLGISDSTVERHRHNIRRKLGIGKAEANLASVLGAIDSPIAHEGDL